MKGKPPARKAPDGAAQDLLELTIEKLVPGGEGLARHAGKVVFVAGGLPGERLRVRLTESKKDYARGEAVEILAASPERVKPPCPVADRCGGCDWQHLSYPEQLRQKVALAADALRRVGGIAWPGLAIEAGEPWRYRSRARLHAAPGGRLGFLARGSRQVIPLAGCPVAHPALNALIAAGPGSGPAAEQYLAWGDSRARAMAPPQSPSPRSEGPADSGVPTSGPGGELCTQVLGKPIRFDLGCFFQSNVAMLEKLLPYALEGLSGDSAMDLYCGVGIFGAFLADRFRSVLAVEENPASLAYARRNIPGPDAVFLEGKLEDLALQGRLGGTGRRPDAVVVDPPRPGLDAAVRDWLAGNRPPRLVYVSCNPVTLARDLKSLTAAGFRLQDLRLFDFYPQTAHVEAVAKLEHPG